MRWTASTTHASATSSLALMEPASLHTMFVMDRVTVWMDQMRWTACAGHPNLLAHPSSTCASPASALTSIMCATGKKTARTTVMKKAVVREIRLSQ